MSHPPRPLGLATAESHSKARLEGMLRHKEMRKRAVLTASILVFLLVLWYAGHNHAHQKREDYALSWAQAAAKLAADKNTAHMPLLLHQSWQNGAVSEELSGAAASWGEANPGLQVKLWSDDDNRELVKEHFPHLAPLLDALQSAAERAAIVKYLYLYKYGGIYADTDLHCARPLRDAVLGDGHGIVLAMGAEGLSPALLASTPGQPFWKFVLARAAAYIDDDGKVSDREAAEVLGGRMLRQAVRHWRIMHDASNFTVLAPGALRETLPEGGAGNCSLALRVFSNATCAEQFPDALVFKLHAPREASGGGGGGGRGDRGGEGSGAGADAGGGGRADRSTVSAAGLPLERLGTVAGGASAAGGDSGSWEAGDAGSNGLPLDGTAASDAPLKSNEGPGAGADVQPGGIAAGDASAAGGASSGGGASAGGDGSASAAGGVEGAAAAGGAAADRGAAAVGPPADMRLSGEGKPLEGSMALSAAATAAALRGGSEQGRALSSEAWALERRVAG